MTRDSDKIEEVREDISGKLAEPKKPAAAVLDDKLELALKMMTPKQRKQYLEAITPKQERPANESRTPPWAYILLGFVLGSLVVGVIGIALYFTMRGPMFY